MNAKKNSTDTFNPALDLVLERTVPVSPERVFAAYTRPELLKQWFAPKPWTIKSVDIEVRPGGRFNFVMASPEGQEFPNAGCYLEVVENRRIVTTDTLLEGFRPSGSTFMTAIITMEPDGKGGCTYTARAIHADEATRKKHEEMGFHEGWGQTLDQLVALAKTL
jgi:uncharacterized protein YndB with AHSA1/START domain